jgi:hypothetical protein
MTRNRLARLSVSILKGPGSLIILALLLCGEGMGCVVCCTATGQADICGELESARVSSHDKGPDTSGDHSCCARAESSQDEVPGSFLSEPLSASPCCFHEADSGILAALPQQSQNIPPLPRLVQKLYDCEVRLPASREVEPFKPPDKGGTYLRLGVFLI